MHSKRIRFLVIIALIFSTLFLSVKAFEHKPEIEAQKTSFSPGDEVVLSFIIKGNEDELISEPFKCEINFDNDKLNYRKINCQGNIKRSDIKLEKSSGFLNLVYNPKKPRAIFFQNHKSELFGAVFTVKNKVCSGNILIHADFKSLDTDTLLHSSDSKINIKGNPAMESCKLRDLTPDCSDLSPDFDPNIFDYTMEVPTETKNLDFHFVPMSEELSVKINRRKLAATGKSTYIKIIVSNKSLRIKSVYNIEVKRMSSGVEKKLNTNEKSENSKNSEKDKSKAETKNKHKKSAKYDREDTEENQELSDGLESENAGTQNATDTLVFQNNPLKIYLAAGFGMMIAVISAYFIIRFVKSRKKLPQKSNNSINKSLKK